MSEQITTEEQDKFYWLHYEEIFPPRHHPKDGINIGIELDAYDRWCELGNEMFENNPESYTQEEKDHYRQEEENGWDREARIAEYMDEIKERYESDVQRFWEGTRRRLDYTDRNPRGSGIREDGKAGLPEEVCLVVESMVDELATMTPGSQEFQGNGEYERRYLIMEKLAPVLVELVSHNWILEEENLSSPPEDEPRAKHTVTLSSEDSARIVGKFKELEALIHGLGLDAPDSGTLESPESME